MKSAIGSLVLLLAFVGLASAQNGYTLTESGTLTASGGDGTACTLSKVAGTLPAIAVSCAPGNNGPAATLTVTQKAGAASGTTFQVGDITCQILMNAGATSAVIGGSITVPPSAASFACSVNLRSSGPTGAVTAQTTVPTQTITWP